MVKSVSSGPHVMQYLVNEIYFKIKLIKIRQKQKSY